MIFNFFKRFKRPSDTTIMASSIVLAGALIGLGLALGLGGGGRDLDKEIERGINNYVAKMQNEGQQPQGAKVEGDFTDDDPSLGDKDAPVTIVEFSDYQCPFCRVFYNESHKQIVENYVETGKVRLVFRDFPLDFHPDALPAAVAAECVQDSKGDETYFEMHNKIFEGQNVYGQGTGQIPLETLKKYAQELGVSAREFDACMQSDELKNEVIKDLQDGQRAGVSGTPGFLINGMLVEGAQPYEVFEQIIEQALSES